MSVLIAALMLVLARAGTAAAHAIGAAGAVGIAWNWQPWILIALATASALYALGVRRMRRRGGLERVIGMPQIAAFAGGMLVLFIALISPLDPMGEALFSVHMVQHLLLMLVAAPLLVWGRPAIAFVWAFAAKPRKRIGRIWTGGGFGRGAAWLMHPLLVWLLFCGFFDFWHLPGPYQWAVGNEPGHALEHLSFLVSALMFWTIVLEPSGRRRIGYGATLLFVATTAVVSALPGALIFLAPRPLYPVHAAGVAAWGLTLMQDQQLAGVIMWIPAGIVYLAAVQWVFVRWLRDSERRPTPPLRRTPPLMPAIAVALMALAAGHAQAQSPAQGQPLNFGGDPDRGARLITDYGCGACHTIPGIAGADGVVGPPLTMIGRRIYVAGVLRNTPDNLMMWLRDPQRVVPGNAMPDMGITPQDARDIAAYLYTLR